MTSERVDASLKLAFSVDEATHASGVGRTKLYEAIQLGHLQSIKIGARRLIPVDALRDWLARNEVRP
jgi:excisionase family DNA binding protein